MQRVGIYAGTFDPIHKGHLSFALESINTCGLDSVVFLPENQPRSKVNVTPAKIRLQQIKAITRNYPTLDTQLLESPQFTITDTLPEIQNKFKNAKLTLLVGSDVALSLDKWDNIDNLLKTCDIAIGMRTHQTEQEIQTVIAALKQRARQCLFTIVHTDYPSFASSTFRK